MLTSQSNQSYPSISPIAYKLLTFENNPYSLIFYDKYYQKNIILAKNCIKIYNKSGKTLKKTFPLKYKRKYIKNAAIDPELNYLLLLEFSSPKFSTITIHDMVNLVEEKITIDFSNLLGMFFVYTHNKQSASASIQGEKTILNGTFCWLFKAKLIIFQVETIQNELFALKIKTNRYVQTFTSTNEVSSFDYSPEYQILCCEIKNSKFILFNLSNPSYYEKIHTLKVPSITKKKSKDEIEESNQRIKIQQCAMLVSRIFTTKLYSYWQFYLKALYTQLYFIHLSILDGKIFIYQVVDLSTLEQRFEFKLDSKLATIQFIDNLIVVHDLEHEKSIVYDIYLKNAHNNVYFQECPITNVGLFQRNNNLEKNIISSQILMYDNDKNKEDSYSISLKINYNNLTHKISMTNFSHNTIIYSKEILINGVMLEESCVFSSDIFRRTTLYFVYFNSEIFYCTYLNQKQSLDPVINLIRREYSKETILKAIVESIKQGKNVQKVINIFNKIQRVLFYQHLLSLDKEKMIQILKGKSLKNKKKSDKTVSSTTVEIKTAINLPKPKIILANKATMITQSDILATLLKNFEYDNNVKSIYVIEMMIHFSVAVKKKDIPLIDYFNNVLLRFIRKNEEIGNIYFYFENKLLPCNIACIGKYFIEQSSKSDMKFQMGMKILDRARKYEDIVVILFQKQMIVEALDFISKNKLCHKFSKLIKKIKQHIILNSVTRRLISQFLKANW